VTTVVLAASGQVWRGHAHVDLTISVGLRAGRTGGQLRVRDAAARLTLTSSRIDRLRSTRHGMLVGGVARVNRRTVPFALDVETVGRATTISLTVTPLRYHLIGAFHGRLLLRRPRGTVSHAQPLNRGAPGKGKRAPGASRGGPPRA